MENIRLSRKAGERFSGCTIRIERYYEISFLQTNIILRTCILYIQLRIFIYFALSKRCLSFEYICFQNKTTFKFFLLRKSDKASRVSFQLLTFNKALFWELKRMQYFYCDTDFNTVTQYKIPMDLPVVFWPSNFRFKRQ